MIDAYKVEFELDSYDAVGNVTKIRYTGELMDGDKGTKSTEVLLRLGIGPLISLITSKSASAATGALNVPTPPEEDSLDNFLAEYGANQKSETPKPNVSEELSKEAATRMMEAAMDVLGDLDMDKVFEGIFSKLSAMGGLIFLRNFYLTGYHRTPVDNPRATVVLDAQTMKQVYTGRTLEWMEAVVEIAKREGFWQQLAMRVRKLKKKK